MTVDRVPSTENSSRLVDEAAAALAAAGVGSPRVDAELLLSHVTGVPRARRSPADLDSAAVARYRRLVDRRAQREPLQHLTGEAPFRYAVLAVGPGVFIPRPETELLVDAVLPALRVEPMPLAVDLCAGSGALAVALAHEAPNTTVLAVERSPTALPWLRRNVSGTGIEVVAADVLDPTTLAGLGGCVDVVVSNPPYVPTGSPVQVEVEGDPAEAVFAGADGLAVIPAVIALAARLLRPGGTLALEHDESHWQALPALLDASGEWAQVADHLDLTGRARYATAVRR